MQVNGQVSARRYAEGLGWTKMQLEELGSAKGYAEGLGLAKMQVEGQRSARNYAESLGLLLKYELCQSYHLLDVTAVQVEMKPTGLS